MATFRLRKLTTWLQTIYSQLFFHISVISRQAKSQHKAVDLEVSWGKLLSNMQREQTFDPICGLLWVDLFLALHRAAQALQINWNEHSYKKKICTNASSYLHSCRRTRIAGRCLCTQVHIGKRGPQIFTVCQYVKYFSAYAVCMCFQGCSVCPDWTALY